MNKIAVIALFLMFGSWPLMSDPIQTKRTDIQQQLKQAGVDPRVIDMPKQVDLSEVAVDRMNAWRGDLNVPSKSNEGIEILPYPAS